MNKFNNSIGLYITLKNELLKIKITNKYELKVPGLSRYIFFRDVTEQWQALKGT